MSGVLVLRPLSETSCGRVILRNRHLGRGKYHLMALWTLVGSRENWITAFRSSGIWGVRPGLEAEWKRLNEGDFVVFYCTSPISGVIGVGSVTAKFKQDSPLWPDEIES